jgi:hypothetical protein
MRGLSTERDPQPVVKQLDMADGQQVANLRMIRRWGTPDDVWGRSPFVAYQDYRLHPWIAQTVPTPVSLQQRAVRGRLVVAGKALNDPFT